MKKMMTKYFIGIFFLISIVIFFSGTESVLAGCCMFGGMCTTDESTCSNEGQTYYSGNSCINNQCAGADGDGGGGGGGGGGSTVTLPNPLGAGNEDPRIIIGNVIKAVLGLVGSLALGIFIFGGLTWITSAGSDEKIKKGKDMIIWATLGLVVIFMSYAMVTLVIDAVTGGSDTSVPGTPDTTVPGTPPATP